MDHQAVQAWAESLAADEPRPTPRLLMSTVWWTLPAPISLQRRHTRHAAEIFPEIRRLCGAGPLAQKRMRRPQDADLPCHCAGNELVQGNLVLLGKVGCRVLDRARQFWRISILTHSLHPFSNIAGVTTLIPNVPAAG